jgi:diguanylate cyclase (GGDEF)-like protein
LNVGLAILIVHTQLKMDTLLKHLVEITGHRDHNLLDISVISALHELVGATQVQVMEVFRVRDETHIKPRVWIKDGKVASIEEYQETEQPGEAIANYPVLVNCIEKRLVNAQETKGPTEHILWIPVWINDKVSTCLQITSTASYSDETLHMMEGILSVYRNFQNLLDYSERDSLTGLLNRKTFDEKFSKLVASSSASTDGEQEQDERRQQADGKDQWLAVVDIDHFKRVNDTFGHLYGDEVLILIANLLRTSFRSQDRIFRFGGEEFVVLLRSTSLDDARKIFERFRTNVEKYDFPQVGQVTVSVGFSSIKKETPVVILGHADQALYYAKTHNRNQVCFYDELVSTGALHSEVSNDSVEFFFDDVAPN